jgi:hypothetical protein
LLAQVQDPSPAPGQPGDKPTPPPQGEPGGAGTPTPKPAENGGEENGGGGEGEAPAPDESAYAALKVEGAVDEAALGQFRELALESRLPVDTAQKILDLHGRLQAGAAAAAQRDWDARVDELGRASQADPFLAGGDVPNGGFRSLKDSLAAAGHFLTHYGDPELRHVLVETGLGNHPAVLRALAKAGRDAASGSLIPGNPRPRVDPLRARYPSMSEDFFSH